jgi:hypothetical protein
MQASKANQRFRMIRTVLIGLAGIACVLIVIVALQPSAFHIARTAIISAPTPTVFAQVDDLRNWQGWSPWEGIDPTMKRNYEGASSGTGAVYSWTGNNQIGEGLMTIIESRPNDFVRIKLEFLKPFAATHIAEFTLKPEGDNTAVTWSVTGTNNFVAKAIGLFMNMDQMIGTQFEKGLAQLGKVVEAAPPER